MKIQPKKEEELSNFDPLPAGTYPFTVLNSDEIASKSEKNKGKMMFALKLNVHGPDGDRHVYDYFADWFSEWKLRHFAETTGQIASYDSGVLDGANGAFSEKTGWVKLEIEPARGNYSAKNVVKDYVVKEASPKTKDEKPFDNSDDVPF